MTHAQKLDYVTSDSGQVNLAKIRQMEKKTGIVPLERIDHSTITYKPYTKNFYVESPRVEAMTSDYVNQMRRDQKIFVKGELVAKPIQAFEDLLDKVVDGRIL